MGSLIILFATLFIACSTSKDMKPASSNGLSVVPDNFDIEGHRGCRGLMPENTWPAMRLALDLGVTTLEMDVVISADNQVVVSHEPWFNHDITTLPDGSYFDSNKEKQYNLYKMPYAEIARYDVGLKPYDKYPQQKKIAAIKPRLTDLIDSVKAYMVTARRPFPYFNIEIKSDPKGDNVYHPEPARFVQLVMDVVNKQNIADKVILQSFDIRPLQYIHKQFPAITTALLIDGSDLRSPEKQLQTLGFTPATYSPHFSLVTPALVEKIHAMKMKIVPWTVNAKDKMENMVKMGVDGLITDYPDKAMQLK